MMRLFGGGGTMYEVRGGGYENEGCQGLIIHVYLSKTMIGY